MGTDRFDGQIMGVGTACGVRIVVGEWFTSPLGCFTDVMIAHADGRRELLAPSVEVADYVTDTYHFDDVRVCDVRAHGGHDADATRLAGTFAPVPSLLTVTAGPVCLTATIGSRHPWGHLLARVPRAVRGPRFARAVNPGARLVMPGVRTYGSAKGGRIEAYVAHDLHRVTSLDATWDGRSLGALAPVDPPPMFGFSSSPRLPSLTRVTTFVTS